MIQEVSKRDDGSDGYKCRSDVKALRRKRAAMVEALDAITENTQRAELRLNNAFLRWRRMRQRQKTQVLAIKKLDRQIEAERNS